MLAAYINMVLSYSWNFSTHSTEEATDTEYWNLQKYMFQI